MASFSTQLTLQNLIRAETEFSSLPQPGVYSTNANASTDSVGSSASSLSTIKLSRLPVTSASAVMEPLVSVASAPITSQVTLTPTIPHINEPAQPPQRFPLLRKKSGELVKSSLKLLALRSMSTPQLPLSPNKSVRFASELTNIKLFDGTDSPSTVSTADNTPLGSPRPFDDNATSYFQWNWKNDDDISDITDTSSDDDEYSGLSFKKKEYQIQCHDIPQRLNTKNPVYLESVQLSSNKRSLEGYIMCDNLAFEKKLSIKLTFNHWKSSVIIHDVKYIKSYPAVNYDKFKFSIALDNLPRFVSIELVVKYEVNHRAYWDNNNHKNYNISLKPVEPQQPLGHVQNYNYNSKSVDDLVTKLLSFQAESSARPKLDLHKRYSLSDELQDAVPRTSPKPQLSSINQPKPKYSQSFRNKRTETEFNSKSYADLVLSYCFFNGEAAKPPLVRLHSLTDFNSTSLTD